MKTSTIEVIKVVAAALGELNNRAVFVGGATIPFYLPEVYLPLVRPTEDIDVVMEIIGQHAGAINDNALRAKGFQHDTSKGAPICRWIYRNIKVDIMSTDASSVGFTNKWYKEGLNNTVEIISEPIAIKILSLPYFLATKITAFHDRGRNDFMGSSDMEDIISILEVANQDLLEKALPHVSQDLRSYLKKQFQELLDTSDFLDCLPGVVFNRTNTSESVTAVLERLKSIIKNS